MLDLGLGCCVGNWDFELAIGILSWRLRCWIWDKDVELVIGILSWRLGF